MKAKRWTSFKAVAWLLSIAMLLLWVVGSVVMTCAVSEGYMDMLMHNDNRRADSALESSFLKNYPDIYRGKPIGSMEYVGYTMMMSVICADEDTIADSSSWKYAVLDEREIPAHGAAVVRDREGNTVMRSGDVLIFRYTPAEDWEAGRHSSSGSGWVDLSSDPQLREYVDQLPTDWSWGMRPGQADITLRITGRVGELGRMEPLKLDYTEETGRELWNGGSVWTTVFDHSTEEDEDLITAYIDEPHRYTFCEDHPVIYEGETYRNAFELLDGYRSLQDKRNNLVLFDLAQFWFLDSNGEAAEYTLEVVTVYNPLMGAVLNLLHVYVCSFILTLAAVLTLLLIIRRNLTRPIAVLNEHMAGDWKRLSKKKSKWREPLELEERFESLSEILKSQTDDLRRKENEIRRLEQVLSYSRKAEENRRRMVSAVAHELKTPLAVIHGYTEGLQERIAEDKREQYLATILTESERMDELVMEMLDLSRLEAGKVKLARDAFSLTELTQSVFDKLSLEAEKKNLKIEFSWGCDRIHGDEGRLRQVILNFASNAVRYTPEGGRIRVRTEKKNGMLSFCIENDAAAFTEEELTNVWETFYRADRARSGKGTGLGLAIAKNIVTLHGGSCTVRNTKNGVEFSFRIPQI